MSDLSSLSADQLAEMVQWAMGGLAPREVEAPYLALAELQTRANQRDNLAGLEELLAQAEERVRLLKIYALAAEKERDEQADRGDDWCKRACAAEARLVETQAWGKQIHDALDGRPLPEHPDEAPARIAALQARLAETLKALERIVAAADADAALNLRDIAFIARTALTTHHTEA